MQSHETHLICVSPCPLLAQYLSRYGKVCQRPLLRSIHIRANNAWRHCVFSSRENVVGRRWCEAWFCCSLRGVLYSNRLVDAFLDVLPPSEFTTAARLQAKRQIRILQTVFLHICCRCSQRTSLSLNMNTTNIPTRSIKRILPHIFLFVPDASISESFHTKQTG